MNHGMGWQRDSLDPRDHLYGVMVPPVELPHSVSLNAQIPKPVYDQGHTNSCTGNSVSKAMAFTRAKQHFNPIIPSRLQIYYGARAREGHAGSDSGAQIRDCIKEVAARGAVSEEHWPFDPAILTQEPPQSVYDMARFDGALVYERVNQDATSVRSALASGYPVIFGMVVFESMERADVARTGNVPMPDYRHEEIIGGHALLLTGYDDSLRRFTFVNSWGDSWGDNGFGSVPYGYILDVQLAADFWLIRHVGRIP